MSREKLNGARDFTHPSQPADPSVVEWRRSDPFEAAFTALHTQSTEREHSRMSADERRGFKIAGGIMLVTFAIGVLVGHWCW